VGLCAGKEIGGCDVVGGEGVVGLVIFAGPGVDVEEDAAADYAFAGPSIDTETERWLGAVFVYEVFVF
jgi:hypothetical protein